MKTGVVQVNSEINCLSCKKSCIQSASALIIECPIYEYNSSEVIKHASESIKPKERELTTGEKREIRKLVNQCANFDNEEQLCLPLDSACFMLCKGHTGNLCKYFRNAVLPLNPSLKRLLNKEKEVLQKTCGICGKVYNAVKNKRYCSDGCKDVAKRQADRERARKYRNSKG